MVHRLTTLELIETVAKRASRHVKRPVLTLADLARAQGFRLRLDDAPELSKDLVGDAGEPGDTWAQACENNIISVLRDKNQPEKFPWDKAYNVAHEIAETRAGFMHTEKMWTEQCSILSDWVFTLGVTLDTVTRILELERAEAPKKKRKPRRKKAP
jgi:hypothetical protein